jgi:mono/diheme cytochrome c family protein
MIRIALLLSVLAALAVAQDKAKITKGSPRQANPANGREMFVTYCAVCHGQDGRGSGPAADALKKAPPDLTQLTIKNNGKFPDAHVYSVIKGDTNAVAHGSKDMPIWGDVFRSMSMRPEDTQWRLSNLVGHIKSIQR